MEESRANSEGKIGGISNLAKNVRDNSLSSNQATVTNTKQMVHRGTLRQLQELMTQM